MPFAFVTEPCMSVMIDGANPPSAKPNWVEMAMPETRTFVSNCSLNMPRPAPLYPEYTMPRPKMPQKKSIGMSFATTAMMNGQISRAQPMGAIRYTGLRPSRSDRAPKPMITTIARTLARICIVRICTRSMPRPVP